MTCEQLVSDHPEAFREAYWSIRRLDIFNWAANHVAPAHVTPVAPNPSAARSKAPPELVPLQVSTSIVPASPSPTTTKRPPSENRTRNLPWFARFLGGHGSKQEQSGQEPPEPPAPPPPGP